ncbi:hypothetical protein Pmar_PMAR026029 [Perkinsus marinus ATCC 50983]|uniref:Uncharacterized protein n=1 Tax=Perkinsus marinus (strain ATCC 50983 / TXsc) TaxID=423536 RepID=C5LK83_PERM5|nr:hypothetical protein Pmar_PMAR026029 [Perkinsus marinus ATCC 50983]EER02870.1 hypothetical protein Pmar_PMAR026029 [Perkinsus marinus ATCC 50983]|eukprot:XP_002771054.1 hypothetical protein Pmar_PMAR026029 [Perkinsus marinus ATCC 50983]
MTRRTTAVDSKSPLRVHIQCREGLAQRAESAKEFIVDARSRPCQLVNAARRYFCLAGVKGRFPAGDWRLTWLEGAMEGQDVPKRRSSVGDCGVKDGDQLALRFVVKEMSPTPEATLESDLGGGEEPVIKKARLIEVEQSQASTEVSGDEVQHEGIKGELKTEEEDIECEERQGGVDRCPPEGPSATTVGEQYKARKTLATILTEVGWMDSAEETHVASGGRAGSGAGLPIKLPSNTRDEYRVLGEMQLLTGDVDGAIETFDKLIDLEGPDGVRSRLCCVVAHCGGLLATRSVLASDRAKALIAELGARHGRRFENIIEAAQKAESEIFKALIGSLLASTGEPLLLPVELEALYVALGRPSRMGWRAAAKRICTLIVDATENGVPIGRPYEGVLKSLQKELDETRTFNEFKEKMQNSEFIEM